MLNKFSIFNAESIGEAAEILKEKQGKGAIFAGGTDLLGQLKREIYNEPPELLINLQGIKDMEFIKESKDGIKIGAMTTLTQIAESDLIKEKYAAIAQAAYHVATPQIRNVGTIGGNICQEVRCWYYRGVDNYFDCMRKGGALCYAMDGDNRYHSIFGGIKIKDAPCEVECPNSNSMPEIMELMRIGETEKAAQLMYGINPLAAVTGRVCPHTCEEKCSRNEVDESVSIRTVEKFLGDYILDNANNYFVKPESFRGKSVAVIGAGPAGMTTAVKLAQDGYSVTVLDQNNEIGGMLTYGIPAYRLDKKVIQDIRVAMSKMGIEFILGKKIDRSRFEELKESYDAVFVGIGAWKPAQTGFVGETAKGVVSAIAFLKSVAEKETLEIGKKIVVIGGGSVAMDAALTARRLGADDITVVSLESAEELPAEQEEVEQAIEEGIVLIHSFGVQEIKTDSGKVQGIALKKCASIFDETGKFSPKYDEDVVKTIDADMIITATGQRVDLEGFESLECSRGINADNSTYETSIKGIYAGGDCVSGPATVVKAIYMGRKAAMSINDYLGGDEPEERNQLGEMLAFSKNVTTKTPKYKPALCTIEERSFEKEDSVGVNQENIHGECNRCMNCGCVAVNCSDIAPALIAFDAVIVTNKKSIRADQFWSANLKSSTVLDEDELVTEIYVPAPEIGTKSAYMKFANRDTIDFPVVGCAAVIGENTKNICLNAVYANPYRAVKAEKILAGNKISETLAEKAAQATFDDAIYLEENKYKIQIGKTILKRTIMACE